MSELRDLRVDDIQTTHQFQAMSPTAPLPWKFGPEGYKLEDAKGNVVAVVYGKTHVDSIKTAGMILTAVNTCGGIRMTDPEN